MSATTPSDEPPPIDFPVVCESCLGENPYMRITKTTLGKECKVCYRPFDTYSWSPGKKMRQRSTVVCSTCAKLKNVCQACVLDLDLKVSLHVRDKALGRRDDMSKTQLNREGYMANAERYLEAEGQIGGIYSHMGPVSQQQLGKIVGTAPYKRLMKASGAAGKAAAATTTTTSPLETPPADTAIKTLFVTNLPPPSTETDVRSLFSRYGEVKSIILSKKSPSCAFINYANRVVAEAAALAIAGAPADCRLHDTALQVQWAKKPAGAARQPLPPPGTEKVAYPSQKK